MCSSAVRFHIICDARIENVGKYQSCMVSKLRMIYGNRARIGTLAAEISAAEAEVEAAGAAEDYERAEALQMAAEQKQAQLDKDAQQVTALETRYQQAGDAKESIEQVMRALNM